MAKPETSELLKRYYGLPEEERAKVDVNRYEPLKAFVGLPDAEKDKVASHFGFDWKPAPAPTVVMDEKKNQVGPSGSSDLSVPSESEVPSIANADLPKFDKSLLPQSYDTSTDGKAYEAPGIDFPDIIRKPYEEIQRLEKEYAETKSKAKIVPREYNYKPEGIDEAVQQVDEKYRPLIAEAKRQHAEAKTWLENDAKLQEYQDFAKNKFLPTTGQDYNEVDPVELKAAFEAEKNPEHYKRYEDQRKNNIKKQREFEEQAYQESLNVVGFEIKSLMENIDQDYGEGFLEAIDKEYNDIEQQQAAAEKSILSVQPKIDELNAKLKEVMAKTPVSENEARMFATQQEKIISEINAINEPINEVLSQLEERSANYSNTIAENPYLGRLTELQSSYQKIAEDFQNLDNDPRFKKIVEEDKLVAKDQNAIDRFWDKKAPLRKNLYLGTRIIRHSIAEFGGNFLSLPQTVSDATGLGDKKYGWTNQLADWADRVVEETHDKMLEPTKLKRGSIQRYKDIDGRKVLVDADGNITDIRDENFNSIPYLDREAFIAQHQKDIDLADVKKDWSTAKFINSFGKTSADMYFNIIQPGIVFSKVGKMMKMPKPVYEKGGVFLGIMNQTHGEAYKAAIDAGFSPQKAGIYALELASAIGAIAFANPLEANLVKKLTGGRILTPQTVEVLTSKGRKPAIKEFVNSFVKGGLGEVSEEAGLEPLAERLLQREFNARKTEGVRGFDMAYDPYEHIETGLLAFASGGLFGLGEAYIQEEGRGAILKAAINQPAVLGSLLKAKVDSGFIKPEEQAQIINNIGYLKQEYDAVKDRIAEADQERALELLESKAIAEATGDKKNLSKIQKELDGILRGQQQAEPGREKEPPQTEPSADPETESTEETEEAGPQPSRSEYEAKKKELEQKYGVEIEDNIKGMPEIKGSDPMKASLAREEMRRFMNGEKQDPGEVMTKEKPKQAAPQTESEIQAEMQNELEEEIPYVGHNKKQEYEGEHEWQREQSKKFNSNIEEGLKHTLHVSEQLLEKAKAEKNKPLVEAYEASVAEAKKDLEKFYEIQAKYDDRLKEARKKEAEAAIRKAQEELKNKIKEQEEEQEDSFEGEERIEELTESYEERVAELTKRYDDQQDVVVKLTSKEKLAVEDALKREHFAGGTTGLGGEAITAHVSAGDLDIYLNKEELVEYNEIYNALPEKMRNGKDENWAQRQKRKVALQRKVLERFLNEDAKAAAMDVDGKIRDKKKPETKKNVEVPFEERTDKQHADFIRDKFIKEFTAKGVSQEEAEAAVAIMNARAKASGLGDTWFRSIEDIGKGEFQENNEGILFQIIDGIDLFNSVNPKEAKDFIDKAFRLVENDAEAKKVYRKLSAKYHPDRNPSPESQAIMQYLNNVKEDYDKGNLTGRGSAYNRRQQDNTGGSSTSTSGGRRYEWRRKNQESKQENQRDPREDPMFTKEFMDELANINRKRNATKKKREQEYNSKIPFKQRAKEKLQNPFGDNDLKMYSRYLTKMLAVQEEFYDAVKKARKKRNLASVDPKNIASAMKVFEAEYLAAQEKRDDQLDRLEFDYNRQKKPLFQEAKGAVETLANGRKVIHALESPDFSTVIHEIAHIFQDELTDAEKKVVQNWANTEEWTTETSETWARGFERYLYDGAAPTEELKSIFQKAKEWLQSIYQDLFGSPISKNITPEVREVFDYLFKPDGQTKEPELTQEELENQQIEETEFLLGGEAAKRREVGRFVEDGITYERNEKIDGPKGNKGYVRFAEDVEVPFTYMLIESDKLQPSHQDRLRNKYHFIPEAQPKPRTDQASQDAEDGFADKPRFKELGENTNAYSGAPVVNERGEVIQGNNRAAGLRKGYNKGNRQYKDDLMANAERFGLSKDQVSAMNNPILVRVVAASDDGAIELGNYDAKDLESGGKGRINPIATNRRIPVEKKAEIAKMLFKNPDDTLNQAIRSNQKRLIEIISPYLNKAQRNTMSKDGALTDTGAQDLESVVQHFLFDNGDIVLPELFEKLSHKQQEGLKKAIPYIIGVTDMKKSILPETQNAIIAIGDFMQSGISDFNSWLIQRDVFNDGKTPQDVYTATELAIAELLINAKTQSEISGRPTKNNPISSFAKYMVLTSDKPGDMYTEPSEGLSKSEAIIQTFNVKNNGNKKTESSPGSQEKTDREKEANQEEVNEKTEQEPRTEEELKSYVNSLPEGSIIEVSEKQSPPQSDRKKKAAANKAERKIKSGELSASIDKDLDELLDLTSELTVGVNPKAMAVAVKIVGKFTKQGVYKLQDILEDIYARAGDKFDQLFEAIKAAYAAYYVNDATDAEFEQMDDPREVRKLKLDSFKEKFNQDDNRSDNSELDSEESTDGEPSDEGTIPGDRSSGRNDGKTDTQPDSRGDRSTDGKSGDDLRPPTFGEPSDFSAPSEEQTTPPPQDPTGNTDGRGNDFSSGDGSQSRGNRRTESEKRDNASKKEQKLAAKIKAQKEAEPTPTVIGNLANIEQSLPFLFPPQHRDVLKAEKRFFGPDGQTKDLAMGKGFMLTNGTGTGKTFSGLGIAKRFIKTGKKNILIVTPTGDKVGDWIKDAAKMNIKARALGRDLSNKKIPSTKDKGTDAEVRVTTFATFRANKALLEVEWDLIIYDESHKIIANKDGEANNSTRQHYLVSNRNKSDALTRLQQSHPVWIEAARLKEEVDSITEGLNKIKDTEQRRKLAREAEAINRKLDDLRAQQRVITPTLVPKAEAAVGKTKVLFLSATPFVQQKNLDYVNQYLFDWGSYSDPNSRVDARSAFFMEKFGAKYRWNNGQLEEKSRPNADAISLNETEFAEELMANGTMSTRAIDSERDYKRHFPLAQNFDSTKFNKAFSDIFTYTDAKFASLRDAAVKLFFKSQNSVPLFESLKTAQMIPRIKQHLEMGRKVVVFHRRRAANASPPFEQIINETIFNATAIINDPDVSSTDKEKARAAIAEAELFEDTHKDVLLYEKTLDYDSAENLMKAAFEGQIGFVNGDAWTKKQKFIKRFNDDFGDINILMIQEESGKEGISLHDTTGNYQRVLINLSMPVSTITAIQVEGRIYRLGSETDAILEYPLLGLDLETAFFGQNLNRRLSTTENLAVGNLSRDLIRSFSEGVLFDQTNEPPNSEQGKGGKEFDKREKGNQTDFQKARLIYASNQKIKGRRDQRKGHDFYPTPEPIGVKMVEFADMRPGESTMEPSAGVGSIAMWIKNNNNLTAIENSFDLYSKLTARAGGGDRKILNQRFEDHNIINKYPTIVMNPPFGTGGKMAMDHIEKAFVHLPMNGRIVALVPRGMMDKRLNDFLHGVDKNGKQTNPQAFLIGEILLPNVTFEQAGTAVSTRIIIIDKRDPNNDQDRIDGPVHYDLTYANDIETLFNELEDIEMPSRSALVVNPDINEESQEETQETKETRSKKSNDGPTLTEVEEHVHTKTKEKLWKLRLNKRIPNSEFAKIWPIVKQNNGQYSPFIKGYLFKTETDAKATKEEIDGKKKSPLEDLDNAKENLKQEYKKWKDGMSNMGIINDPMENAKSDYALYKAFANYAREWIKYNMGTFQEWVASLGADAAKLHPDLIQEAYEQVPKSLESFVALQADDRELPGELSFTESIREWLQDTDYMLKRVQKAVEKMKGYMPDSWNVYEKRELMASKVAFAHAELRKKIYGAPSDTDWRSGKLDKESFLGRLQAEGIGDNDFGLFIYALHAKERNARVREIKDIDNGSGLTDEQAERILDHFRISGKYDVLLQFAEEFSNEVVRKIAETRYEAGIINEDQYNALIDGRKNGSDVVFEHYVPLKVKQEFLARGAKNKKGGRGIYSIVGTDKFSHLMRNNPMHQAVIDLGAAMYAKEQNEVHIALAEMIRANPDKGFWRVINSRFITTVDEDGNVIGAKEIPPGANPDELITYYENGKVKYIHLMSPDLLKVMKYKGMTPTKAGKLTMEVMRTLMNLKRYALTAYNPDFILTNFTRDLQEAMANLSDVKEDLDIENLRRTVLKSIPNSIGAITRFKTNKGGNNAWDEVMLEAARSGMLISWLDYDTGKDAMTELEKLAEKYHDAHSKGVGSKVTYPLRQSMEAIALLADISENAVRLATYKALRDKGVTAQKSAAIAKNISLNFEKRGTGTSVINTLFLFSNAGIQGVARSLKNLRSRNGQKYLLTWAAASFGWAAIRDLLNGDDDDYLFEGWDAENNFIIPAGDFKVKIPKPYSLMRLPLALGENAYWLLSNRQTVGRATANIIQAMIAVGDPIAGGSTQLTSYAPTITQPFLEVHATNKNWIGSDIVPFYQKRDRTMKTSAYNNIYKTNQQWAAYTKNLGEQRGRHINPVAMQHYIEFAMAGLPKVLLGTSQEIIAMSQGERADINKIMIARRFMVDPSMQEWRTTVYLNDVLNRGNNASLTKREEQQVLKEYENFKKGIPKEDLKSKTYNFRRDFFVKYGIRLDGYKTKEEISEEANKPREKTQSGISF